MATITPPIGSYKLRSCLDWLLRNTTITTYIVGEAGIGKSEIVAQAAKAYWEDYQEENKPFEGPAKGTIPPVPLMTTPGMFDWRLSLMSEPGDMVGIPRPHEVQTGMGSIEQTRYAIPECIPLWHTYFYVIFLDEMNRANRDLRNGILQLILDRRLHSHRIPVGTRFVAAGNPDTDQYDVESFDEALSDRMLHLSFKPDFEEWLDYAMANSMSGAVLQYVNDHRDQLTKETEALSLGVSPSPRKWEMMNWIMQKWSKDDPFCTEENLRILAGGLLGYEVGVAFAHATYQNESPAVSAEDLFEKTPFPVERLKEQVSDAAKTFYTVRQTDWWWRNRPKEEVTEAQVKALSRLLTLLPKDQAVNLGIIATDEQTIDEYETFLWAMMNSSNLPDYMRTLMQERKDYA